MIDYHSLNEFDLDNKVSISDWIKLMLDEEIRFLGEICFIFCNDDYLLEKNNKYLKHNLLTDIISFDYSMGSIISGDIFISVERVVENAKDLKIEFKDELHRVIIHGILHFCGYKDKSKEEVKLMRIKEDYYLSLRTF